ncbi:unnamed protein product [Orchesella dallaii]|uniref:Thioredoxin domain-containing protein n=1 Tax=Orchesella dallaii TaxID=48710 RepID=A0ABP1PJ02_9HEXA
MLEEDFNAQLADAGDNIVLAAFTAVWCGPCRFALPAMQKLEVEFPNVVYLTIDIDQQEDIGRYFGIRAVPTFIVLRNSQKIVQEIARNERQLRELIQRHIN